jgi:predicted O-linked N-acetylglucosamine transferase (SPINDLY family)
MHMAHARPLLFARKPAPVQICWLAYPGTTGMTAMDYRLTDPYLDPPGADEECYAEKSFRLADTFWCYDPLTTEPAVNPLPALKNGFITFGSLNNFCKVNEPVLKLWAQVLRAVDRSQLLLLAPETRHRSHVTDFLESDGISSDRIRFADLRPRSDYLQLYHQIDLGLDTFPYNGHTTSLDSYWMGVPVVTMAGETVVGRAGVSQLMNLELPELIARSPDEFVAIARGLVNDLPRLSELRSTLRPRMEASPLMNAPRFAHSIEAAYREIWRVNCDSP